MPCRQGFPFKVGALPPVRPLAWNFGLSPNRGHSPLLKKEALRQGIALPHIAAAKPGRAMTNDFGEGVKNRTYSGKPTRRIKSLNLASLRKPLSSGLTLSHTNQSLRSS